MSIVDLFSLSGKRALVTGAGRGIGRGFALALAEAGADVAALDIDADLAQATAAEIDERDARSLPITCDVTDSKQVQAAIRQTVDVLGGLEVAVNNAGIVVNEKAEEMTDEQWDRVMAVNLRAVFLCAREEGRIMISQGTGSIINTASMSASVIVHPQPQCAYNASKSGVVGLTRSLAAEWASYNVRVNAISPGYTLTELVRQEPIASMHDQWKRLTPMGRLGEVEDICGALIFLASDASRFMTGQDLIVDGGYTLW